MKALLFAFGTRGDVQPFLALARALDEQGHEVVLVAPERFGTAAAEHGIAMQVVDDGPLRMMNERGGVGDTVERGIAGAISMARQLPALFRPVLDDAAAIAVDGPGADADVIVHNGQIVAAPHLAEALGIPCALAMTVPLYVPTASFPWPGHAIAQRVPRILNRSTYAGMRTPQMIFGRVVDQWRDERLGLSRRPGRHNPLVDPSNQPATVLSAVSRHVLPPPEDWPSNVHTTGYWFLPAIGALPESLRAFLDNGSPPVLVGFGSMSGPDPSASTTVVLEALERVGVRAVLASGWGGLDTRAALPEHVHALDEVAHDLLLPHVSAMVHHGGAGTTGAAAAAGVPQVITPFVADQEFWGRRMHALGVAPEPLSQKRVTAEALASALDATVGRRDIVDRARDLSTCVRAEDGVREAVSVLEKVVCGR